VAFDKATARPNRQATHPQLSKEYQPDGCILTPRADAMCSFSFVVVLCDGTTGRLRSRMQVGLSILAFGDCKQIKKTRTNSYSVEKRNEVS